MCNKRSVGVAANRVAAKKERAGASATLADRNAGGGRGCLEPHFIITVRARGPTKGI